MKETLDRATQLLGALWDEDVNEETRAKIREWFAGDMSMTEKYSSLKEIFVGLQPNLNPDMHEYRQYRKVCSILGFDEYKLPLWIRYRHGVTRVVRQYAMRAAVAVFALIT